MASQQFVKKELKERLHFHTIHKVIICLKKLHILQRVYCTGKTKQNNANGLHYPPEPQLLQMFTQMSEVQLIDGRKETITVTEKTLIVTNLRF